MDISAKTCCKINIGLNIVAKRPDGYHDIETIFYPVPLMDEIRITDSVEDGITLEGQELEGDPNENLVLRTVRLLREQGYPVPPLHITLNKKIPSGAGLGGGSSDAACVMKILNQKYKFGLSDEKMERMISRLGADCPFFIKCKPVYAEGIGDIFSPIDLDLTGWHLVLVKPDDFVSTREAYSMVRPKPSVRPLTELVEEPVSSWENKVCNDFEDSVFPNHPKISSIRKTLYKEGASYACMSGSGSSVFGLFRNAIDAEKLFPELFTFQCRL